MREVFRKTISTMVALVSWGFCFGSIPGLEKTLFFHLLVMVSVSSSSMTFSGVYSIIFYLFVFVRVKIRVLHYGRFGTMSEEEFKTHNLSILSWKWEKPIVLIELPRCCYRSISLHAFMDALVLGREPTTISQASACRLEHETVGYSKGGETAQPRQNDFKVSRRRLVEESL